VNPGRKEILDRMRPAFERAAAPYARKPSALVAVLHEVQAELGFISPEAEGAVADFLGVGLNAVHEVATFYTLFRVRPGGRHRLKVCRSLSCDLLGARELVEVARAKLGIPEGGTTADGLFSLETVECLGCCDKAPAVQVDLEPFRGPMTPDSMSGLIDRLAGEKRDG